MNLQDKSCLAARSEKQIVTSVSVVISTSSFEKCGIQDLDKILEVILRKHREEQHHVQRCSNSGVNNSCVLKGCFCGIEEVRQTLKQVLCGRSKTQFASFDQELYYFIKTNCYEKFEKLRDLCILFKEHDTDYGFIIEFESKMDTDSAHLQSLLLELKTEYQVQEFHKTDLMTFDCIYSFMKGTKSFSSGEIDLVVNEDNGLVKIVGSCDAVLRTKQRYEEHVKTITSDSTTALNTLSGKNLESSFEKENPDDRIVHAREIPERNESHRSNVLPTVSRIKPEEAEINISQNANINSQGINCGDENAFQTGELYSETSHNEKQEIVKKTQMECISKFAPTENCALALKNDDEIKPFFEKEEIQRISSEIVEPIANQNINNITKKLNTEYLCGEEDKTVKNETNFCQNVADPEIISGEDNELLTREQYEQSRNSEGQKTFDLPVLMCDKANTFHAINSEAIEDSIKEGTMSFMEYRAEEPKTMNDMITESEDGNVNFISQVDKALLSRDQTDVKVQINEGLQHISSETKGLDMHDSVTSARMPLLQQYAEDENSFKNDDLHEKYTIKTREEISDAHQNVNILNSKTSEGCDCRSKTDENVVPQLTPVQQSKATEIAQISQVLEEIDKSKSSQMESTDNSAQAMQKYGANCSSMTALDSNSRDSNEVKNVAALYVAEDNGNNDEELSSNECNKLVGEEIPEQTKSNRIENIKQMCYNCKEEISSENLRNFIGGQEQKEMMKEPNQLKNSKCLDDGR